MQVLYIIHPDDGLISNLKILLLNHYVRDGTVMVNQDQEPVPHAGLSFAVSFFGDYPANGYITMVNSWPSLN